MSIFYPYPDITNDSSNYILCAKTMEIGGYRPVGYSWFINFFHNISESISFLFFGQYFIHVLCTLFFIFSLKYFIRPAKKMLFYIFALILILGPHSLYVTNLIMSESIFNSLTLLFITSALWFNSSKHAYVNALVIIFHLVVLYFAFNVRYVALFYPIISLACFLLFIKNKFLAVILSLLPVFVIINTIDKTKRDMKKHTGIETFSGFSGWALANNAVSIIPHIDLKPEEIKDKELRYIHEVVTSFPDSVYNDYNITKTYFMWDKEFPGKKAFLKIANDKGYQYVQGWVYAGTLYNEYGKMLIKKYPLEFFRHYILMNTGLLFKYWDIKNPKVYEPDKLQKQWFNLDIDKYEYECTFFSSMNPVWEIIHYIRWLVLIGSIIWVIVKFKWFDFNLTQKRILGIFILFLLGYYAFSIIGHPINNYRYLIPTYAFVLAIPYIVLNQYLIRKSAANPKDRHKQ
ncbi:MAG: hypothetical protein ACQES1_10150 [Bacteroidota bacterium]